MATTKLGNTKSASRAINYAEKRAEEKSGLNCDIDYAKSSFKQTRALYGKENGVQAHTVIQSFKPGEVTPEQCNQLGLELAEKIAPNLLKSLAIDCRVSLSNFGATNRLPCAFFFTKAGTLIFKVSADCLNFKYSDSLTRKLICFGSLRLGLRFRPTVSSLATNVFCSLI